MQRDRLSSSEKLLELWFAPKSFESTNIYKRLVVRSIKRYMPRGGGYFIQRFGVRLVNVQGNLDSRIHFEQLTLSQAGKSSNSFLIFRR